MKCRMRWGTGREEIERGKPVGKPALQTRPGTGHRRPTSIPFRLVSVAGQLNPLSDRSGSEPSSEASESIACKTCLAESNDPRLQPHAAAHLPGTII